LQDSALFVCQSIFRLEVIKFGVSFQQKFIFALNLVDVACQDAIVTMIFIDQAMQLINFFLQLFAANFEKVNFIASLW